MCVSLCYTSVVCDGTCEQTMRASCICWWRDGRTVRLKPLLEVGMIHPLYFLHQAIITKMRENEVFLSACIILNYSNNTAYNEDNLPPMCF